VDIHNVGESDPLEIPFHRFVAFGRQRENEIDGWCRLDNKKNRSDVHGQDLIEYALISGFVAIAAGAIMPNVTTDVSTVFSKIASTTRAAATS
jgi:Flp pilus assembly pilin Flp